MRIYTRTGDKGQTGLLGGQRVGKDHLRIEAYGTVDELNSHLGMLRDLAPDHSPLITAIQEKLFAIGSRLSSGSDSDADKFKVPSISDADIENLERTMDAWDMDLPAMRNFILPGGHSAISQAHICRTVCRRAERRIVELTVSEAVPEVIVRYVNRLSDLLFVLSRHLHLRLRVPETPWKPKD